MSKRNQPDYYPQNISPSSQFLTPQSSPWQPPIKAAFARPPSIQDNSSAHYRDNRYFGAGSNRLSPVAPSISEKYSLSPDPSSWGTQNYLNEPEPDDYLHNPDPRRDRKHDAGHHIFTMRGFSNVGCLVLICLVVTGLFAGYPIASYLTKHPLSKFGGFNLGGINASGQVPAMPGNWGLIDLDTPKEFYTKPSPVDGSELQLVFSDEFNTDGRTFYPGDDPYWEAVDLHYWGTGNLEWYDPEAATTKDGALEITLSKKDNHDLEYQGGMIATWNKFCFTGGLFEASVMLPGFSNVAGLWPAVWTLGNLGRAGYGASLEGLWPYTYDECDVGTVHNQTVNGLPEQATVTGSEGTDGILSYLPGQRLSRCTCPGESHPGPMHADGTYVGRGAPEIDMFEAQVGGGVGEVSQSGQWAPFNAGYNWLNTSDNFILHNSATKLNSFKGNSLQQATSGVTKTNQDCYQYGTGCFSVYAFEYKPGFDDAYISWVTDNKRAWTIRAPGMAADKSVEISGRPVPQEPMYLIANLGMSPNFGAIDFEHLKFPAKMRIDYVRVYQRKDSINIGCDPENFPTRAYIEQYPEAYTNPNLTTWRDDYKQPFPKNRFLKEC